MPRVRCATLLALLLACPRAEPPADALRPGADASPADTLPPAPGKAPADVFDRFLGAEVPPADGFDFPVGGPDGDAPYRGPDGREHAGWRVAVGFAERYELGLHTGEDWNGVGGGDTDFGQPVRAIADGTVVVSQPLGQPWGNVVAIDHAWHENHERHLVRSVSMHLDELRVKTGARVRRGDVVGTVGKDPAGTMRAHLHFELRTDRSLPIAYWPSYDGKDRAWLRRHYLDPREFIRAHRRLTVPGREPALVLVHRESGRMRLYLDGKLHREYSVGFGQAQGRKTRRGDNRTPLGMYFVTDKSRGPFQGEYAEFYGGRWIALNYPNPWDAAPARKKGLLSASVAAEIERAWSARARTPKNTLLGGGIGFHGWAPGDWDESQRGLSWGCVVLHNRDIRDFFDRVPTGAMVIIFR